MSYQVLSLKLRPQRFDEVVGQTHVTRTLQNAIGLDRVAHGYIFSGPRGVGKTTTARILAKVLNCKNPKDNNPCGTCVNCTEITQGSNLDVQELDGASNRGIDEMRDLREAVKYPPNNSKYRIYIIDEVHMLTREAFNALLKTLEEPPPHVIFIMATTDAHKVPATILSRTQRFDFKHISINDISEYLKQILESENIKYDTDGIRLIAQKADGSLRDSLSLLDQTIAYASDALDVETIRDVLGIIKENVFLNIIQTIEKRDHKEVIHQLSQLIDAGYAISDFISGFNEFLRNCMIQKTGESAKLNLSENSLNWLQTGCRFSTADFLRMLDLSLQFESKLRFLQQPQISLEALFIKLSMMDASVDIASILSGEVPKTISVKKPESQKPSITTEKPDSPLVQTEPMESPQPTENNPVTEKLTTPTPPVVSEPVPQQVRNLTLEDFNNSWTEIIEGLEEKNSKIAHFLEEAKLSSFDGKQLLIELVNGHRFHLKTLEKDAEQIASVINDKLNQKIRIKFHIQENNEEKPEKKKPESAEHPLFMKVLETFEGEIIR
ncbi:MAG TPA: DNA polymerase III subunit gamma/tau [Candidatus Marinimicrobia bacterium]|nr:DNA polymerase III subunit gamma/tau [Candidatus Neomarinimicrobiota bacterium]HIN19346.1 DNA polymerase III subunit gamma/tau [Candidatus Neomarinimicrobiota bacterium]